MVQLNVVYGLLGPWVNHWQPAMKLVGKQREGTRVTKHSAVPQTPSRRVLATVPLSDEARARLEADHLAMGTVALRAKLGAAIQRFWKLPAGSGQATETACG